MKSATRAHLPNCVATKLVLRYMEGRASALKPTILSVTSSMTSQNRCVTAVEVGAKLMSQDVISQSPTAIFNHVSIGRFQSSLNAPPAYDYS